MNNNIDNKENKINDKVNNEVSCGAFVIDGEKVLLVKHKNGNHWDCPKGHVEDGETKQQTAIREVLEETGIMIKIVSDKEYVVSYMPSENIKKTVIFFEAIKVGGELIKQEREIQDIQWFEFKEAIEKITFDSNRDLFKTFLKDKNLI